MSLRELDRLKCIQAVIDGEMPARCAAERLAMSTRKIRRLANRYRVIGWLGMAPRLGPLKWDGGAPSAKERMSS